MKRGEEKPWQKDPASLTGDHVQLWSADGIMLGRREIELAREYVREGQAFVISDQAINLY